MPVQSVKELFVEELRDIYHAEKQITKALPKMIKGAANNELKQAFTQHLEETRGQVERLEEVFEILDVAKRGKRCEAMEGLIEEGQSLMEEVQDASVRDVGMVTAAQKIEHYEIAAYGSAVTLAKALGHDDAADLLAQTLEEEKRTDQRLTQIAESSVNPSALGQANAGEMDEDAAEGEDEDEDAEDAEEAQAAAPARKPAASARAAGAKGKASRAKS